MIFFNPYTSAGTVNTFIILNNAANMDKFWFKNRFSTSKIKEIGPDNKFITFIIYGKLKKLKYIIKKFINRKKIFFLVFFSFNFIIIFENVFVIILIIFFFLEKRFLNFKLFMYIHVCIESNFFSLKIFRFEHIS